MLRQRTSGQMWHPPCPAVRGRAPDRQAPYAVVLVRLAEGADLMLPGGWAGRADGTDLAVGLPVRATFEDIPGEPPAALIRWTHRSAEQPST